MNIETIKSVYFVGAGGIGMSALVRYFLFKGKVVAGYDRTPTPLTETLIAEGAQIHYEENVDLIPEACKDKESTLVIYTPAVPQEHEEIVYFRNNGFEIQKRAQVLGTITHSSKGLCVAGTHGKTTTSTMTAHLLHQSHVECTAFLGGISKNYGTNLLLSQTSPYTVIEADEFDRSFHWLSPYMTVITSTDPDHLDIYGTEQAYLESFEHYTTLIQPGGALIIRKGISLQPKVQPGVRVYTYSRDEGDFHAENIRIGNGEIFIDFVAPDTRINDIQLGIPVSINIENGVAAMALAPQETMRILGHGLNKVFQARMLISKVLVAHGYTDNVPLPDITTKEKAQQYIGLDMAVEKADKDKFLKEIVLEWLQKAKANGRIVN